MTGTGGARAGHVEVRSCAHLLAHPLAQSLSHSLSHSFTCSLAHSLAHSSTRSLAHSLIHLLTCRLTCSIIHSFSRSLIHSLTHSLTHSFTCSIADSLALSFTHSLAHSHSFTPQLTGCARHPTRQAGRALCHQLPSQASHINKHAIGTQYPFAEQTSECGDHAHLTLSLLSLNFHHNRRRREWCKKPAESTSWHDFGSQV